MKRLLFNRDGHLRNGWWALIFLAVLTALGVGQFWLLKGLELLGVPRGPWRRAVSLVVVLVATWLCTRLRRERLSSVGLVLDRRWARELGWGSAVGMGQILVAAFLVWVLGGVRLGLDPARSLPALASGLLLFLVVAVHEETLFRGFLFQRLRDGIGVWPTQVALAALFALAHWGNPGMEGGTKLWATLDIGIGALVLGLAYLRTRSLALPIGMHLGWNWMQGPVLGFGVSGMTSHSWFRPAFLDQPAWLTGGAFGLEASVFGVLVDLIALAALWSWKGSVPAPPAVSPAQGEGAP